MGFHLPTLCLLTLAALVIFSAANENCTEDGLTYKHGDPVPKECGICECYDGTVDCENVASCNRKKRRAPSEDILQVNYLDEPEVIDSSFHRKKRSAGMLPMKEQDFIDGVYNGKVKTGHRGGGMSSDGMSISNSKSEHVDVSMNGPGQDEGARLQQALKNEAMKALNSAKKEDKYDNENKVSTGNKFPAKSISHEGDASIHVKSEEGSPSHADGSQNNQNGHNKSNVKLNPLEKSSEESEELHGKFGAIKHESVGNSKLRGKSNSDESESKEHGKSQGTPISHKDGSDGHNKFDGKVIAQESSSEEDVKPHGKVGSIKKESMGNDKVHGKSDSDDSGSKEHGKSHKKADSHDGGSAKRDKSHEKPDSHKGGSEKHDKSNKKSVSHELGSAKHGKSNKKPDLHGDDTERDGLGTETALFSSSKTADGNSCLFNHVSLADGERISLNCLDCTCKQGSVNCEKNFNCAGLCSVSGFQMIRTFDGSLYDSPGKCSYILLKANDISIYLNNKKCDENPDAICIDSVEVHFGTLVSVKINSDGNTEADVGVIDLPYHMNDLFTVKRSSSVFMEVATSLGINVQYDFKGNRLYVAMNHKDNIVTKGLCGTFNDNRNDDYISSNGMLETVADLFSGSWKVHQCCTESERSPEDNDKRTAAGDTCDSYLIESIFDDCRVIVDISNYKPSCTNSVYYGGEDMDGMCLALADYAYHCAWAGISVAFRSSFSECEFSCSDPLVPSTITAFTNRDCRAYADQLFNFPAKNMLNEVCICPSDQYYDSTLDTCVNGDDCPCYANQRSYKVGEIVKFPNDKECPCQRIMECSDEVIPTRKVPVCPKGELYSDCSNGNGKSCEKSCQNLEMIDQSCPSDCVPGCICSYGNYRNEEDKCVPLSDCKCLHGDDKYNPGETLVRDCNTCTCNNGKFQCTYNKCTAVCNAYGESQYILFDKVWKKFATADCEILLVTAQAGNGVETSFSVTALSVRSKQLGGSYSTKNITIRYGDVGVRLSEFGFEVVRDPSINPGSIVNIYQTGFFLAVEFPGVLALYYDGHLDLVVHIQPQLLGKVDGMCGDADGATTSEVSMGNTEQYASQYLTDQCQPDKPPLPPPSGDHSRYVEERCSLLKSDVFYPCHSVVSVDWYYSACVDETTSCREGESCLCFCTAVAAYARACCRQGVSVDWRTADTCPAPCEYYNRDAGEGPYHVTNFNQMRLVVDLESGQLNFSPDIDSEDLKASITVTPGLYKDPQSARPLISLESTLRPNYFIVQGEDGTVRLEKWQPSVNFRKRATFILRNNRWFKGYDALESFSQRGYYLTINEDNSLIVAKYMKSSTQAASFKLTMESFGLPSFSLCLWRYKPCEPPCIKSCQDPDGSKCTLTLNVEGCFPHCAEGLVFDELTHRCVNYKDCVQEPTPSVAVPASTRLAVITTEDTCANANCPLPLCKIGAIPQLLEQRTDPCCDAHKCVCEKCNDAPDCGYGLVATPHYDEKKCCPTYICECGLCPDPKRCDEGFILVSSVDKDNACCKYYECVPGTTTAGISTATPLATTARDACNGVKCEIPQCQRTGETPKATPSTDPCCSAYKCECQICTDSTDCGPGYIAKPRIDENHCCTQYVCEPEPTSPTTSISTTTSPTTSTTSTTTPSCSSEPCVQPACKRSGESLQKIEGAPSNPCCPDNYKCVCKACPSPTPCGTGYKAESLFDPATSCCAEYVCHQSMETTTPVQITTTGTTQTTTPLPRCQYVSCDPRTCEKEGSTPVLDPNDNTCCPRYSCECIKKCPPPPYCGPGIQTVDVIDIETQCCPDQRCPNEGKRVSTTTVATTTRDQCKDITCDETDCKKTGAVPVHVEGLHPCCKTCKCQGCDPPQDCGFGLEAVPTIDHDTQCCPTYKCKCKPTCPSAPDCDPGFKLISYFRDGAPCCAEHDCVPEETTTSPGTTASTTTPITTPDICKNVVCTLPTCTREGEIPVQHGKGQCCPIVTCECKNPCESDNCDPGLMPVSVFDQDKQCCPKYRCECPTQCPSTPECGSGTIKTLTDGPGKDPCCSEYYCVPFTTTATSTPAVTSSPTTPKDICAHVTCAKSSCTKSGEVPQVVEDGSGHDPCCKEFNCVCSPCRDSLVCGDGFTLSETMDWNTQCCPDQQCVPLTTTTPGIPTTTPNPTPGIPTTTPNPCSLVTCAKIVSCTKTNEYPVPAEGSAYDPCCPPEHICQCDQCSDPPTCRTGLELQTKFDPKIECCPRYSCEPLPTSKPTELLTTLPCDKSQCAAPPECSKRGETAVVVLNSGADPCCPEFKCVCKPCSSHLSCPPGYLLKQSVKTDADCCDQYICEPECENVKCNTVPDCKRKGEIEVLIEGSGFDPCCPPLTGCECEKCPPPPVCEKGQLNELLDKEKQCCPSYNCVALPPPPPPTTTTPATKTPSKCKDVLCEEAPICKKKDEFPVPAEGSGDDPCCPPKTKCECLLCAFSVPACLPGFRLKRLFDPTTDCCAHYVCECDEVCPAPEKCTRTGEAQVTVDGSGGSGDSGDGSLCCQEYKCACNGNCDPAPECPSGYHIISSIDPEKQCCPHSTCVCDSCTEPPTCDPGYHLVQKPTEENVCCHQYGCELLPTIEPRTFLTTIKGVCEGVICSPPPVCTKTGETAFKKEDKDDEDDEDDEDDKCCPEYECRCETCHSPPVCPPDYYEAQVDKPDVCCLDYTCERIPTTPGTATPTTTPEFCVHVTCTHPTCTSNEILVEKLQPLWKCCPVFECEEIPTTERPSVATSLQVCNRVTCPVKVCKPHEKLVAQPTPPIGCCREYDCVCQCDSVPTCGSDERLVTVSQVNQCCPKLRCERKKEECETVSKTVELHVGKCRATVKLQACGGYCHSATTYDHLWEPVSKCNCCTVTKTRSKKFELPCPNGTKAKLTVKEAEACRCESCSGTEDISGDGSGSGNSGEGNIISEEDTHS